MQQTPSKSTYVYSNVNVNMDAVDCARLEQNCFQDMPAKDLSFPADTLSLLERVRSPVRGLKRKKSQCCLCKLPPASGIPHFDLIAMLTLVP